MADPMLLTDDPAAALVTANRGAAATLHNVTSSALAITDTGGSLQLKDGP